MVKAEQPSKIRGINEYDVTWIRCLKSDYNNNNNNNDNDRLFNLFAA